MCLFLRSCDEFCRSNEEESKTVHYKPNHNEPPLTLRKQNKQPNETVSFIGSRRRLTNLSETGPTMTENSMYIPAPIKNMRPTLKGLRPNWCHTNYYSHSYSKDSGLTCLDRKGCIVGVKKPRATSPRILARTEK